MKKKKSPQLLGGTNWANKMTPLQIKIIKIWQKKILVHPSYPSIAKQLGCSDETVHRAVQKFLSLGEDTNVNSK